jgi:hypothetical protein
MNVDLAQELLNELGSSLEHLETQQAALFQFLKDHGVVTDDQFAPYLSQAGKTSSVRWRAARIRLEHLFSGEKSREEEGAEKEQRPPSKGQTPGEQATGQNQEKEGQERETKTRNDEESNNAPQQHGEAGASTVPKAAEAQSPSEKDKK